MLSIQVPHFFNHSHTHNPLSTYNPMSQQQFLDSMSVVNRPSPLPLNHAVDKSKSAIGARRRPSRAGTRSVSTLTDAQLARKRANDREAQRAIRQRTKDHIDSLERRLAELTANNDSNAKLANALQRNDELKQENNLLRSRVNATLNALAEGQPITPEMLQGPSSTTRRLRVATRSSSVPLAATVPRSVPNSATIPVQQDQWSQSFAINGSEERSPSLADVSPVSTAMRWGADAHPSPVLSDATVPHHHVDPSHSQSSAYNYINFSSADMMSFPTPAISESHGYVPHSASQITPPTISSPVYTQYPATPQSFISPEHVDHDTTFL